jgi:hypothetical protein
MLSPPSLEMESSRKLAEAEKEYDETKAHALLFRRKK